MTDELAPPDRPGLTLEAVAPELIGVDVTSGRVPPLMRWCLSALKEIAPDPGRVRMVVTGDFVASVRDRLEGLGHLYDLTRGSGFVGGKTMLRVDGTVDVLLHAAYFMPPGGVSPGDGLDQMVKRTAVHEAQHVAMEQNQQGFQQVEGAGFRTSNLRSAAASIIDEYRAELGVPASLRAADWFSGTSDVTRALRSDLARVVADYQVHLDVRRLVYDVVTVTSVAWRSLAYMAAWSRGLPDEDRMAGDASGDPLWQRMIAGQWDRFVLTLGTIPPATTIMSRPEIDAAVTELSEVLNTWLFDLGFSWTEADDGDSLFRIVKWDLLDPEFTERTNGTDIDA